MPEAPSTPYSFIWSFNKHRVPATYQGLFLLNAKLSQFRGNRAPQTQLLYPGLSPIQESLPVPLGDLPAVCFFLSPFLCYSDATEARAGDRTEPGIWLL